MSMTRPPYPSGFREQMVELVRSGRSPEELAREFEPSAQSIRNWVGQADRDEGRRDGGLTSGEREELRRLSGISKSQVSRLFTEIDDKIWSFLERPLEGEWPYLWLREGAPGRAHRLDGADRRCRRQRPGPARGARHGDRRVRGRGLLDRVPALPRPARAQGRETGDLRRPQGPEGRKPYPRRHPAKMPRVPVEEPGFGTRPVSDHATAAATSTFWTART